MKLYTSTTSPYSRAILLAALAQGDLDGLQLVYADPWATPDELTAVNPLSQVPALITGEGTVICGTAYVADFLLGHPLQNAAQAAVAGYAQALLDQVVKAFSLAKFLPQDQAEHPHIPRAREAVVRGLEHAPQLDAQCSGFDRHLLAMAFSYAELRHPTLFPHLSEANRAAFAEYQQRRDVQAVSIEALERKPATLAAVRAAAA
ncbi:glutathione S-transferase N-terminal domain-containing protein [Neisseria sp. WLZKY-1]|uniref:glutathione S-transferase N-terminal domain-containing protein n=1 Tax=Neisseria sp. WLZKY-1 TaxID=3390377 RepID=UPI00397ABEA6